MPNPLHNLCARDGLNLERRTVARTNSSSSGTTSLITFAGVRVRPEKMSAVSRQVLVSFVPPSDNRTKVRRPVRSLMFVADRERPCVVLYRTKRAKSEVMNTAKATPSRRGAERLYQLLPLSII